MFQTLVDGPRGASSFHQRAPTRHMILRCRDSCELCASRGGVTLCFPAILTYSAPADETLQTGYPGQGTCHNEVKNAKRMSTGRLQDRYYRGVTRDINCMRCLLAAKCNIAAKCKPVSPSLSLSYFFFTTSPSETI